MRRSLENTFLLNLGMLQNKKKKKKDQPTLLNFICSAARATVINNTTM